MDVITAVNSAVTKTFIANLQSATDPFGTRLSLMALTELDCADAAAQHDAVFQEAGRRGLARDLLIRLVKHACHEAHNVPLDPRSFYVVRAPIELIADEQFQVELERTVDTSNMNRKRICFEIPEMPFGEGVSIASLWRFKDRGFLTSFGNFGTGMAPFEMLRYLPLTFLQIAPSFVSKLLTDPFSMELVRTSNQLGHLRGLRTIGAGAQSIEHVEVLRCLGVDYVEGPAISQPIICSVGVH